MEPTLPHAALQASTRRGDILGQHIGKENIFRPTCCGWRAALVRKCSGLREENDWNYQDAVTCPSGRGSDCGKCQGVSGTFESDGLRLCAPQFFCISTKFHLSFFSNGCTMPLTVIYNLRASRLSPVKIDVNVEVEETNNSINPPEGMRQKMEESADGTVIDVYVEVEDSYTRWDMHTLAEAP